MIFLVYVGALATKIYDEHKICTFWTKSNHAIILLGPLPPQPKGYIETLKPVIRMV